MDELAEKTLKLPLGDFLNPIFAKEVLSASSKRIGTRGALERIWRLASDMFGSKWRTNTVQEFLVHEKFPLFFRYDTNGFGCGKKTQEFFAELLLRCGLSTYVPARLSIPDSDGLSPAAHTVIKMVEGQKAKM